MKPERRSNRPLRYAAIAGVIVVSAAGLLVADTLTRPLDVQLRTHIEIYREVEDGDWKKVDEVGPASMRFDASLLEMARGQAIGTDFAFETRSRAGEEYSARLADDADVSFDPRTGQFDADLTFVVRYGDETARVTARPTTETRFGPAGARRGSRAQGVLGRGPTTFTLVSVNELELEGERSLMLVTEEQYRMIPRGEGARSR